MLLLKNFFVLIITLLITAKLPTCNGNSVPVQRALPSADENDELTILKNVLYKNIMEDFKVKFGQDVEITPEMEAYIDKRIHSFWRAYRRTDRKPSSLDLTETLDAASKREPRSVTDETIEADTAGAEVLFLKGFRERGYVPVNFPIDICLLKVGKSIFAASLHVRKSRESFTNNTVVSFYIRENGEFRKYMEYTAILARKFDCISHASLGFVAVVNYYDNAQNQGSPQTHRSFDDGSPVFQIQEDGTTEIVQKFSQSNQNSVHMWIQGNHFYLTHTYMNLDESVANICPLYRWSGYHFDVIDELPCYNSIHIEAFTISQTLYIAIANQMNDEAVDQDTFSDVFKFDYERQKFDFHQKIYAYSVSHISYFYLDNGDNREHFLITGNSRAGKNKGIEKLDYDHHSIVYKYLDGYFVPFQKMELHQVKQFLPVMRENGEFLLLVHCSGRPLQIYEYDNWKFIPSRIDYTREAFGIGVSSMRVYRHIINASLIVIANRNVYGSMANLFSPIYGIENDLKEVYAEFVNWCGETTEQLSKINLEDIYNRLAALPKSNNGVTKLDKDVELRSSTVQQLHTSVLHTEKFVYDQRTFDYLNRIHNQLQGLKKRAQQMQEIIKDSLMLNETMEIRGNVKAPKVIAAEGLIKDLNARKVNSEQQARVANDTADEVITVDRLIIDEELNVNFLNGYASSTLLHTTDDLRSLKDVDIHAKEVEVRGALTVNKLIDGVHFTADNVLLNGANQVFSGKTLYVDHLDVKHLETNSLNSTDIATVLSALKKAASIEHARSQNRAYSDYPTKLREIRVNNLNVTGLLNDIDINYLDKNALKVVGDQVITANFNFDNIITTHTSIPNQRLSGIDLNSLVLTEPTPEQPDFRVRQEVQFLKPVYIRNLHIEERINHIKVKNNELQVLLVDPKEPQLITGTKTFDNVELLGPIFMQGKINSSSLSKLNPTATIDGIIYLEGDYEITGDVFFGNILNATNIYGASQTYNYLDVYRHGLPLNARSSAQKFTFKQPVTVDNVFGTSFNGLNPNDFISIAVPKTHKITGKKTFTGDLTVRGDRVEAAEINQVDIKNLNQTVLKRTGNQVVKGTIHFKELIVSSLTSKQTFFEDRPLETLLTSYGKQHIKSTVRLQNCKLNIKGDMNVREMFTNNGSTVFNYDIDYMIRDTLRKSQTENENVIVLAPKTFHNLTVKELILHDQAMLNGVDMQGLKKLNQPMEKTVVVEETLYLKNPIKVRNVFFNGSINGVRKEDFGRAWLLSEYNQTFTAPQIFEDVIAPRMFVDGFFNDVKIDELVKNLYYLDRAEQVERAIFHEGLVSYQPITIGGLVSGLNLSTDVLLKRSPVPQHLDDVRIDGNLLVNNGIYLDKTLNNMNYAKLREFVVNSGNENPVNVEIMGNMYMENQPEVIELNGYNVEQLHREAWLSNRDEVLTGAYTFQDAKFDNYVYTKGPINGLYLDEICKTYLSVSKPQNVTTPLIFKNAVYFKKAAVINNITLEGLWKGTKESTGIDIVYFDKHVFKIDVPQTITGKWIFHDLEVHGKLNLTTLNGLDIQKDILLSHATSATFTGKKRINNLYVHRLKCPEPCIIQGVDVTEWFANAVLLNGNHTIEGETYIEAPTIIGDIVSHGPVNNITFDRANLLLKSVPQDIKGDLYVKTKFPERNLIYPSSIETLEVETINGKNFNEFTANLARGDQDSLNIDTPVTLMQTLETQNLDTGDNLIFGVNINQLLQEVEYRDQLKKYESKLRGLHIVGQSLVEASRVKTAYLSHYQPIKSLPGKFRNVATVTLPLSVPIDLMAAHVEDGAHSAVEFYRWNKKENCFKLAKGFPPITAPNLAITGLRRIKLNHVQHLFIQFYDRVHHVYRQSILDLEPPDTLVPQKSQKLITIYEFNSTVPRDIVSVRLLDIDCVGLFSALSDGMEIHCLRLENLIYYMEYHQTLGTPAVRQALYLDGRLVLLSKDDLLQVWYPQPDYKLGLVQLFKVAYPSFITVAKFEHQLFIAVNSEHDLTDTAHHGSIEIWRNLRPHHHNGTFVKYQTILAKMPKQIHFSVMPSIAELMLYTITEDIFHPLVIYRYEGVSGFREYLTSNTLRVTGSQLRIVKLNQNQRELLALVTDKEIAFIEAFIKEA